MTTAPQPSPNSIQVPAQATICYIYIGFQVATYSTSSLNCLQRLPKIRVYLDKAIISWVCMTLLYAHKSFRIHDHNTYTRSRQDIGGK